jgi:glycosyltransferase involved in cell wall biosynthesis
VSPPPDSPPRPRLLVLSQTLPFPPDGGVKIRAWHTWRELAQAFDLTALCFYRRGTTRPDDARAGLQEIATIQAHAIPQEGHPARLAWDHLRSLATGRVYTRYVYDAGAFRRDLRQLLDRGGWSAVHAESLDLAGYFPSLDGLPLICVHHDLQSGLLRRRAQVEGGPRSAYLRLQAGLMEREEAHWAARVTLNVVVSEADRRSLLARAPSARVLVAPNGVDADAWTPGGPGDAEPDDVVFVGGSDWFPNLDGITWFAASALPRLRAERPGLRCRWVGRAAPAERERLASLGVESTGYVEDPRPHVARARCVIVPLRVGGGTRIKLLEAWAAGKAVVSTTIGAEGLEAVNGENLLVRDTPEAFAAALAELLDSPDLRRRLGEGGRATVLRSYRWEAVGDRLRAAYCEVARA